MTKRRERLWRLAHFSLQKVLVKFHSGSFLFGSTVGRIFLVKPFVSPGGFKPIGWEASVSPRVARSLGSSAVPSFEFCRNCTSDLNFYPFYCNVSGYCKLWPANLISMSLPKPSHARTRIQSLIERAHTSMR
jgi:hypothetical protein